MAMAMLIASIMPVVFATDTSIGIGIEITPEEFEPLIWMCDSRTVFDDNLEGGRATWAHSGICYDDTDASGTINAGDALVPAGDDNEAACLANPDGGNANLFDPTNEMVERANNYAFEGEQIQWNVLVMDKNKIEQIEEVVATIGDTQGTGNDIEVECQEDLGNTAIDASCNARIDQLPLTTFDSTVMRNYVCTLTVETVDSMDGEYWVTVEAIGVDGSATVDENEYWYLNPTIALSVEGDLSFDEVMPGTVAYSETMLIGNDADDGSGVLLDMFISGTDFYDSAASDARCPVTNRLKLGDNTAESSDASEATPADLDDSCTINLGNTEANDAICYYATQGAYSTEDDPRNDAEGYVPIVYGDAFTTAFYNDAEIIAPSNSPGGGILTIGGVDYYAGNVLTPGSEIAITFKLGLPEPCVGNFDSGSLYFWGEAI